MRIKTAEAVKMNGQSLNGRNFTRKPVKSNTSTKVTSPMAERT